MAKFDDLNRELDELAVEVTALTEAKASAVALLDGLAEQLRQHANDPAEIRAIADRMDSTTANVGAVKIELSDAVLRNTPGVPTPPGGGVDENGNPI